MEEIDLKERFPDLEPIKRAPTMWRLNGIGTGVYGKRDVDTATGTYVKTLCASLVWIPIVAVRAYRVADAEDGGWYFLGRVPLSSAAKFCNVLVLLGVMSLGARAAWAHHTNTPEYRARQKLATAAEDVEAGRLVKAAGAYSSIVHHGTYADDARAALRAMVDGPLGRAPLNDIARVFDILGRLRGPPLFDDLTARARTIADARGADDPAGALTLLDAARAPPDDPRRVPLLERLVAAEPDNLEPVLALALTHEARGDREKCRALLEPRRDRLGESEGARILGQLYTGDGRIDEALALLEPYARVRLARLRAAEKRYDEAWARGWDREVRRLETGRGPESFYRQYDQADDAGKQQLVNEYIGGKLRESLPVHNAFEAMQEESGVVPVAIDLGLLHLRRGQRADDPAERKRELEAAEQSFLAIRGLAGNTDEFRLFLGQVYYWLGRGEEGAKLFQDLLAANERQPRLLMAVGRTLREVGAYSEARPLVEEAYRDAKEDRLKREAAVLRAYMPLDNDDTILWLERGDTSLPHVQGALNGAKAVRAQERGNNERAAAFLRKAVAAYEAMQPSGPVLNNLALEYFRLYETTGDLDAFRSGVDAMRRSVALQPDSSVGVANAASANIEAAVLGLLESKVDLRRLRWRGSVHMLDTVTPDGAAHAAWVQQLRADPRFVEALAQTDRILLLAPRNAAGYESALAIRVYLRDRDGMRALHARVAEADLDLADVRKSSLEAYRGKERPSARTYVEAEMKRLDALAAETEGATFAFAAVGWTTQAISARVLGMETEPVLKWIEKAHAVAPSDVTFRTLVAALLLRAGEAVAGDHEDFRAGWTKSERAVGYADLIAVELARPGPARDALVAHADFQRAVDLIVRYNELFPDLRYPWHWAMLRTTRPAVAKALGKRMVASEFVRLYREAKFRLAPFNGQRALTLYWLRLAAGDEKGARAVLAECAAEGTPLPEVP